jgi:prepilin-type N-terminal cleavage/methylation domain-containing protein
MKHPKNNLKKKGFTLVEIILASSIFAVVGLIAVTVFVNILRIQQRVSLENALYEDARFMMERIAREIRTNTVDYEEYYNKLVEKQPYGKTHGCYATRFYNPGSDNDFGAKCNNGENPLIKPDCVIDKTTLDINTGQNPYFGNGFQDSAAKDANAFCDKNFASDVDPACGDATSLVNHNLNNQLYLIDSKGREKSLLAQKALTREPDVQYSLALLRLDGEDGDNDNLIERWTNCSNNAFCCAKEFDCNNLTGSLEDTLNFDDDHYKGFIPISPSRTNVKSLQFYVAPLEDPRKAFAEDSPNIQQQPHVTVILTVEPAKSVLKNYNGEIPTVTLQTTITSRVYNVIPSYFGEEVCVN